MSASAGAALAVALAVYLIHYKHLWKQGLLLTDTDHHGMDTTTTLLTTTTMGRGLVANGRRPSREKPSQKKNTTTESFLKLCSEWIAVTEWKGSNSNNNNNNKHKHNERVCGGGGGDSHPHLRSSDDNPSLTPSEVPCRLNNNNSRPHPILTHSLTHCVCGWLSLSPLARKFPNEPHVVNGWRLCSST